ncbi:MAG: hypothetical protein ABSG77_06325 [Candidatus Acidiferrum sp.]|jgi:hypothetical protein
MAKRRFFFSRTFFLIVGAIFCILTFCYLWGPQTVMAYALRKQAKKIVILDERPLPLTFVSNNSAPGRKLVHAGFSFEVPWEDLDVPNSKSGANIAAFKFRSGRTILFFGPSPNHEDLLSTLEKSFGDGRGNLKRLLGAEATKTNYAFHRAILEETPDRISPFIPKRDAIRSSMLLVVKAISSVGGETGLFEVQSSGWRGFQFDDPAKRPKRVTLELYDNQDRHIEIIFWPGATEDAGVTQADINRGLESLRATDEPQTIPPQNGLREKIGSLATSHASR